MKFKNIIVVPSNVFHFTMNIIILKYLWNQTILKGGSMHLKSSNLMPKTMKIVQWCQVQISS